MSVNSTLPTPKTKGTVTSGHLAVFSGTSGAVLQDGGAVPTDTGITQLTGNVTAGPGSGSVAATIANSAVTLAKIANAAASSKLLGSGSSGSGSAYVELTLGTNLAMSGTTLNATDTGITALTGDVTAAGSGSVAATIANSAVTYAKIQDVSGTNKVLGRSSSGSGVVEEIATTGSGNVVRATSPSLTTPVISSLTSGSGTVTFPGYTGSVPIVVKSSGAAPSTSSLTEANLAVANIPALAANDRLEIFALFTFTGTAGAKTPVIRHNTSSAATSGGTNLAIAATAANILSARYVYQIQNANSVSAQVANFGVGFGTSTTTNTTGAINTGSASFINFNALVANGGDAAILVSYSVTIYPGV